MSEHKAEKDVTAIDANQCAFVCYVELDGTIHLTSATGYSNAQVAVMLRQIADVAEAKDPDHPASPPASECDIYGGGRTCLTVGSIAPCDRCCQSIRPGTEGGA